jgi:hypothetical protein
MYESRKYTSIYKENKEEAKACVEEKREKTPSCSVVKGTGAKFCLGFYLPISSIWGPEFDLGQFYFIFRIFQDIRRRK